MKGKQRILKALRRQCPDTVPTFEWFIDATVGEALVGSADILDIVDRLDLDGVNLRPTYSKKFLDDSTFVDEWGIKRQVTEDTLPALLAGPIPEIKRHQDYQFPDPEAAGRFQRVEAALERFGDEKAIVLNLRDGFSDMRDLLGYEQSLMALMLEPAAYRELLQRAVDYNVQVAEVARRRYGLEIVATTDDVADATGMLVRPEIYFERIGPAFRRVVEGYKNLGYSCIKHCDGNIDAVSDFWVDCGIDCLDPIDPGGGYTMAGMKAKYGDRVCLKGNIDCTGALCSGSAAEVSYEVKSCIEAGAAGGGLILSSSNTIHHGVKPENYRAMLEAARQ